MMFLPLVELVLVLGKRVERSTIRLVRRCVGLWYRQLGHDVWTYHCTVGWIGSEDV